MMYVHQIHYQATLYVKETNKSFFFLNLNIIQFLHSFFLDITCNGASSGKYECPNLKTCLENRMDECEFTAGTNQNENCLRVKDEFVSLWMYCSPGSISSISFVIIMLSLLTILF